MIATIVIDRNNWQCEYLITLIDMFNAANIEFSNGLTKEPNCRESFEVVDEVCCYE